MNARKSVATQHMSDAAAHYTLPQPPSSPPLLPSLAARPAPHIIAQQFEGEREGERTLKDSYCMSGSVEPRRRAAMLMRCGSTLKQIRSVKQAVARLNRQRWQVCTVVACHVILSL